MTAPATMEHSPDDRIGSVAAAEALTRLADYLELPRPVVESDPAGAMLSALGHLACSSPIEGTEEQLLVRGLAWLLPGVPNRDPRREEVEALLGEALDRLP